MRHYRKIVKQSRNRLLKTGNEMIQSVTGQLTDLYLMQGKMMARENYDFQLDRGVFLCIQSFEQ